MKCQFHYWSFHLFHKIPAQSKFLYFTQTHLFHHFQGHFFNFSHSSHLSKKIQSQFTTVSPVSQTSLQYICLVTKITSQKLIPLRYAFAFIELKCCIFAYLFLISFNFLKLCLKLPDFPPNDQFHRPSQNSNNARTFHPKFHLWNRYWNQRWKNIAAGNRAEQLYRFISSSRFGISTPLIVQSITFTTNLFWIETLDS